MCSSMLIAYFQNVQQINNYLLNRPVINFYTVSFSGSWGEACFSAGAGTPMMRRFNLQRGFPTLSSHCKNGVLQSRNVQGQKVEESGQAGEWVVSELVGGDRQA